MNTNVNLDIPNGKTEAETDNQTLKKVSVLKPVEKHNSKPDGILNISDEVNNLHVRVNWPVEEVPLDFDVIINKAYRYTPDTEALRWEYYKGDIVDERSQIDAVLSRTRGFFFRTLARPPRFVIEKPLEQYVTLWKEIVDINGKRLLIAGDTEPQMFEDEVGSNISYNVFGRSGKIIMRVIGTDNFFGTQISAIRDGVVFSLKQTKVLENYKILDTDQNIIFWFRKPWPVHFIPLCYCCRGLLYHHARFDVLKQNKRTGKLDKVGLIAIEDWKLNDEPELGLTLSNSLSATEKLLLLGCSFCVIHRQFPFMNRISTRFHGDIMISLPLSFVVAIILIYLIVVGVKENVPGADCTGLTIEMWRNITNFCKVFVS